jgi:hypothetical protein
MTIVPIGNIVLQVIQVAAPGLAKRLLENIAEELPDIVAQMMNGYFDDELTQFLGRCANLYSS